MADETKQLTAAEKREIAVREKMRVGGMTRENAEMVLQHQEEEDGRQAAKAKKSKAKEGADK